MAMLDRILNRLRPTAPGLAYLWVTLICLAITLLALPLRSVLDAANIVMLFLLGVVAAALLLGRKAAVLGAFLSVALFDFFFVPPQLSFAVADVQYLVTFAVMLLVGLVIAHMTSGLQQSAVEARAHAQRSQALYHLAKLLAGAASVEQVSDALKSFMAQHGMDVALLLPNDAEVLRAAPGSLLSLNETERTAAKAVYQTGHSLDSATLSAEEQFRFYQYLAGASRGRGVLVIAPLGADARVPASDRALIEAVSSLIATALERLHFVEVAHRSHLETQSERLRAAILSALSHDVRTPLTAIYGLADTLVVSQTPLPSAARETLQAIRDQSLRLNNMVSNLLDMARLQAGRIKLRREWQPLEEVIGASIKLIRPGLRDRKVAVRLPDNLPLVQIDAVLLERVLCNLLENAAKYSPEQSQIEIGAALQGTELLVSVCNAGPGFPVGKLDSIFALFERGGPEPGAAGFGVGLAICRAIVEAHGGRIQAFNPDGGGACVRFSLPLGQPPSIEPEVMS